MQLNSQIDTVTHEELERCLGYCEKAKITPIIHGTHGVGKTEVVHKYGRKRASELGRDFVIWHQLSSGEKRKLYEDAGKRSSVYLMFDNRAASNDSTDDKGIPNINNPEYLVWVQSLVYKVFEKPETRGIIFNDEMNLAPPLVQNSMYKMVYDKAIGDISFNEHIFVICAGNLLSDNANVQPYPDPLRTRSIHFLLDPAGKEEQIKHWADSGVDTRLVAFFSANPDKIIYTPEDDSNELTHNRPRTVYLLSEALQQIESGSPNEMEDIRHLSCGLMTTYVGDLFIKWLEQMKTIDVEDILRHPKKAAELSTLDEKYGLVCLIVDEFIKSKDPKDLMKKAMKIFSNIEEEIGILMLRMMKDRNKEAFKRIIFDIPEVQNQMAKVAPLMLEGKP